MLHGSTQNFCSPSVRKNVRLLIIYHRRRACLIRIDRQNVQKPLVPPNYQHRSVSINFLEIIQIDHYYSKQLGRDKFISLNRDSRTLHPLFVWQKRVWPEIHAADTGRKTFLGENIYPVLTIYNIIDSCILKLIDWGYCFGSKTVHLNTSTMCTLFFFSSISVMNYDDKIYEKLVNSYFCGEGINPPLPQRLCMLKNKQMALQKIVMPTVTPCEP